MADRSDDILKEEKQRSPKMFSRIHRRYDLLNRLLTFGLDLTWRRKLAAQLSRRYNINSAPEVLDLAAGTGDMAIAVRKRMPTAGLTIADPSEEMLDLAERKLLKKECCIARAHADATSLGFRDRSFDCITIAFGVRNFPDLDRSLSECARVLRDGGGLHVLEFGWPSNPLISLLYRVYSATFMPFLGWLVAGDTDAYGYLRRTIRTFPFGNDFLRSMQEAGFTNCSFRKLSFGIVYIYHGEIHTNS